MKYIVDDFPFTMIPTPCLVEFKKLEEKQFIEETKDAVLIDGEITLEPGDEIYVRSLFVKAVILNDVIDDLIRCRGMCDDLTYDVLVAEMMDMPIDDDDDKGYNVTILPSDDDDV